MKKYYESIRTGTKRLLLLGALHKTLDELKRK